MSALAVRQLGAALLLHSQSTNAANGAFDLHRELQTILESHSTLTLAAALHTLFGRVGQSLEKQTQLVAAVSTTNITLRALRHWQCGLMRTQHHEYVRVAVSDTERLSLERDDLARELRE